MARLGAILLALLPAIDGVIGNATVSAFEGVDFVLVHHFPKSGGSSLRQIVCEAAQRRGWPMALCYCSLADGAAGRCPTPLLATCYDARAPARVIMGHSVTERFHATRGLPPAATFACVSRRSARGRARRDERGER